MRFSAPFSVHRATTMYPLKTVIEFLLTGVTRIPAPERLEALLSLFGGLLPNMSPEEIDGARQQVIARFWTTPEVADALVDLMEGHLALRALLASEAGDSSQAGEAR